MRSDFFHRLRILDAERPLSALLLLRFGFFVLLAYDLWLISLSHAPRYGAGDFNVSHLDFITRWCSVPTPSSIGALYLATGALAIWISIGLSGKIGVFLCTLSYCFCYFWSQADSYQHHYLLCLCLALFIGEPWRSTKGTVLTALMWQMAFIYAWTAFAKCEPVWLSGDTLSILVAEPDVRQSIESWGAVLGFNSQETFQLSAWAVMLGEWFAALAFIIAPLRPIAFFIVPWFHIMVEWIGFDIELFSYYMLLLNLTLLSPSLLWRPLDRLILAINLKWKATDPHLKTWNIQYILFSIICGLCSAWYIVQIELEGSLYGGILAGIIIFGSVLMGLQRGRTIHLISLMIGLSISITGHALLVREVSSSSFRFKYYRMWGGDLKRRGHPKKALEIYKKANLAQDPTLPARFIPAGELALQLGETELGLNYLSEGSQRRLVHLEDTIHELISATPQDFIQAKRTFERAARSATQAHQKLYRAYLNAQDPRAREVRSALDAVQQMITQARVHK